MVHYSQQQEFMLTLHTLAYIVRRDRADEFFWSFITANSDIPESNPTKKSHASININQNVDDSSVLRDMQHSDKTRYVKY